MLDYHYSVKPTRAGPKTVLGTVVHPFVENDWVGWLLGRAFLFFFFFSFHDIYPFLEIRGMHGNGAKRWLSSRRVMFEIGTLVRKFTGKGSLLAGKVGQRKFTEALDEEFV